MRAIFSPLLLAALSLPAIAAEPAPYVFEAKAANAGEPSKGCGYTTHTMEQDATRAGWGPSHFADASAGGAIASPCAFPKGKGPNAALAVEARKVMAKSDFNLDPADVVYVDPEQTWDKVDTRSNGEVIGTGRAIEVRVYRKGLDFTTNECGSTDVRVCCDVSKSCSPVNVINVTRFRLDEAAKLKAAGDTAGCQLEAQTAFQIASGTEADRELFAWSKVDAIFKSRWDGTLTKPQLKSKLGDFAKQAQAKWAECGGSGKIAAAKKVWDLVPEPPKQ